MEEIGETHESADGGVLSPFHEHPLYPTKDSSTPCVGCDGDETAGKCSCHICEIYVHKDCLEIINPSNPTYHLSLTDRYGKLFRCSICTSISYRYIYLCSFSGLPVCEKCARKPFTIDPGRAHEHPLLVFLKGSFSFPCDACGVNDAKSCLCLCIPCRFTIHRKCVYLPRVICINRHDHRISHVPRLGSGNWSCGVCRKEVNGMHGAFSCLTCTFAVHSRCAIRSNVWDGIELEGVPEEDPAKNLPFKVVGEGLIKHFTHEHNLRLINEDDILYDKSKQCHGCVLPIFFNACYICTHCDFILHETCANLSKKKRHPSVSRQLTLYAKHYYGMDSFSWDGPFSCFVCSQRCSGFAYVEDNGGRPGFTIDVRCVSIYAGFVHNSQPHSMLVISDDWSVSDRNKCSRCGKGGNDVWCLTGREDLFMCYKCATIPELAMHKYDVHLLSLRFSENAIGDYWCDICEKIVDPHKWFYTCDMCSTTLHIDCVLGAEPYLRVGSTFKLGRFVLEVLSNDYASRPRCDTCSSRIEDIVVYKSEDVYFCSLTCIEKNPRRAR
ncbi:CHP-rich zinc finger protein-like [Arabidopsis thaliana]|jgi:hypothetical protein|uniref:CHP-rich zinc finger protein-like n=1 Tax=Arabidopsis thaliana TaxID=3702 RepID=Q9FMI0_ARATH|nr:Cysteine/Histidine-rich C1 domain family protein [Arabidopsis thaliana]AED94903.1 Cysteine/Histidine-rich C1 domain family protein [Arabidopsis thaliana]BAB08267.1 CHP-rich zinc finger protein-like [Arabidopsis thaliana]|eukprot:NP_199118.1 Cysteine/Histidine-rich C1 domain family protein [Arabidopsis thaliana]